MEGKMKMLLLGALAIGTLAALETSGHDDVTISIRASKDAAATTVHIPELAVGETRTLRSESGKDVVVRKTEEGFVLTIDGRDFEVTRPDGATRVIGLPGEKNEETKTTVTGDGVKKVIVTKHGYGFSTGDQPEPRLSASEFLDRQNLAALAGTDARTRETFAKAIDELVKKGALIVPSMGLPDGEGVEIKVTKRVEK
jgi:hypothetical protein